MTRPRRPSKKTLLISAAVLAVIIVIVAVVLAIRSASPDTQSTKSSGGKIELQKVTPDMTLKSGAAIEGTVTLDKDATLYYTVSASDKRVLGAGNIQATNNRFSRNLDFDSKNYKGKSGQLQVYMQDKTGTLIDSATVPVIFE